MNRRTMSLCLVVAVVTAVVTSLVWNTLGGEPDVLPCPVTVVAPAPEVPAVDTSSEEELQALRDTIASQKQQIRLLEDQEDDFLIEDEEGLPVVPQKSYMSHLEEKNPERHQRLLEWVKNTNDKSVQVIADTADFLFNLDMSLMTPKQQQNHQKILNLLEDSWAQVDQMQETLDGPEFEKAESKLHKNVRAMNKAFKPERKIALEQLLQKEGFSREQATAIRAEIEQVYTKTDPANILPGTQFIGDNVMFSVQEIVKAGNSRDSD